MKDTLVRRWITRIPLYHSILPLVPFFLSLSHVYPMNNTHETRRIRLLDDGLPGSPMDRYDFGASPGKL